MEYLDATRIVLQLDVGAGQIRRDGMMHANAKVNFPGVRISFESRYGPLTYATDMHECQYRLSKLNGWQANVRAIALALEALRAVDRYGVTRRGEQYTGWTAIAAEPAAMTREQAAEFLAHWSGLARSEVVMSPSAAWRRAARKAHPDAGGDADTFARLTRARELLERAA